MVREKAITRHTEPLNGRIPSFQTSCPPCWRPRFSCCRQFSRISAWCARQRAPSVCRWYKGLLPRSSSFRRCDGLYGRWFSCLYRPFPPIVWEFYWWSDAMGVPRKQASRHFHPLSAQTTTWRHTGRCFVAVKRQDKGTWGTYFRISWQQANMVLNFLRINKNTAAQQRIYNPK